MMAQVSRPIGEPGAINTSWFAPRNKFRSRAEYTGMDGKVHQITALGETKGKAEANLRVKIRAQTSFGSLVNTENPRMSALLDQFLDEKTRAVGATGTRSITASTLERYSYLVEAYVRPAIGELQVRRMNVAMCEQFIESFIHGDKGLGTATGVRTVLRQTLQIAVRYGYIVTNPVSNARPLPVKDADVQTLTADQLEQLRSAVARWASGRDRPGPVNTYLEDMINVLAGTGLRISELLALEFSHCHLDDPVPWIHVCQALTMPMGSPGVRIGPVKGGKDRSIAIPPFVVDIIRRRLQDRPRNTSVDAVFVNRNGGWMRPSSVRRALRQAMKMVGIEQEPEFWCTPHTLRRTAATFLANQLDPASAAEVLGHPDVAVTKRYYLAPKKDAVIHSAHLQGMAPKGRLSSLDGGADQDTAEPKIETQGER